MDKNDDVPVVELCPDGIKSGVSEEDSIIIAGYREPISVECLTCAVNLRKCSARVICRESCEQAKNDWDTSSRELQHNHWIL